MNLGTARRRKLDESKMHSNLLFVLLELSVASTRDARRTDRRQRIPPDTCDVLWLLPAQLRVEPPMLP